MPKLYEKVENPKETFREMLKDTELAQKDMQRIDNSFDKRIANNNLPTMAELKNLAIRALSKSDMDKGKQEFLKQTQTDIKKFCEENDVYFSKRQYSDIMKRAEKSMSPLEVRMDLYKTVQVNNLTQAFTERLKDNNVPVSSKFTEQIAQNIERSQVSMACIQQVMDKTLEKTQSQELKMDKVVKDGLHVYSVNGKEVGNIVSDAKSGEIFVNLKNKNTKEGGDALIFTMNPTVVDGSIAFETSKGMKMTRDEAMNMADKSLINAINTARVIDVFRTEVSEYIKSQELERSIKKTVNEMLPESKQISDTAERERLEEAILPTVEEVKEQSKESSSKTVVEGPDL
jgi:hypothetical protein